MQVYCPGSGFPETETEMSVCGQVIQCEMLPGEASKAMRKQDGKRKKLRRGAISGKGLWQGTSVWPHRETQEHKLCLSLFQSNQKSWFFILHTCQSLSEGCPRTWTPGRDMSLWRQKTLVAGRVCREEKQDWTDGSKSALNPGKKQMVMIKRCQQ